MPGKSFGGFLSIHNAGLLLTVLALLAIFSFDSKDVAAATIQTYRDTLSDSAPGEYSNHTVEFTTTALIPPSGYVRFRPSPGDFTIPSSANFTLNNVELQVSTSSGFYTRSATSSADAVNDGIAITTGTSGQIEITLNASVGIPANANIRLKIGNHTANSTSTDVAIINPSATTSFPIFIETGGIDDESVQARIAIVDSVSIPFIDTTETDPPVRFNGAPSGVLSGTTLTVQLSLETDEFATCRYSTASGTPYSSMTNNFDGSFVTVHTLDVDVATNTAYIFYVRCIDDEGNFNIDDYEISFSVPEFPEGTPGDPGGGDPGGGGSGGGGSGGGGGGGSGGSSGGDEGGGFEGTNLPYQSGDARVIINGYAFPRSEIVVLVDGVVARRSTAGSTGSFSVTLDAIARGVYTFGVYAIDQDGTKSSTYSTTFSVIGARGSTLSNVNIMPSIVVDPDPVDPGQMVTFRGYSIPNATITIENQSDRSSVTLKTFTTTSDSQGKWSINVSTVGFSTGTYKVRAKAKQETGLGISTNYSGFTYYGVGEKAAVPRSSDLNRDGFVNLIDFSILLFWWNSDGGNSDPPADINADGRVSLTDFSIMVFNWTG